MLPSIPAVAACEYACWWSLTIPQAHLSKVNGFLQLVASLHACLPSARQHECMSVWAVSHALLGCMVAWSDAMCLLSSPCCHTQPACTHHSFVSCLQSRFTLQLQTVPAMRAASVVQHWWQRLQCHLLACNSFKLATVRPHVQSDSGKTCTAAACSHAA